MEGRGKWAVMGILVIGLALASFGWWWNLQRSKRCLEYWGPAAAGAIRLGNEVTAYQLALPEGESQAAEKLSVGETEIAIVAEHDISQVPGLLHARNSLLDDASYDWQARPTQSLTWTHAMEFRRDDTSVLVLFDLQHFYVQRAGQERALLLVPKMQEAFRKAFGARYFDDPELLPPAETPHS